MTAAICLPCSPSTLCLGPDDCRRAMAGLHPDWVLDDDSSAITRSFAFKGFAKAAQLANLAVWYAEKTGHHPDIGFGWGYCRLTYTTHEIGGLSEADFATAAGFDRLIAG
jgi:4a-hydroxytetrahydrobiopterin dehydratase